MSILCRWHLRSIVPFPDFTSVPSSLSKQKVSVCWILTNGKYYCRTSCQHEEKCFFYSPITPCQVIRFKGLIVPNCHMNNRWDMFIEITFLFCICLFIWLWSHLDPISFGVFLFYLPLHPLSFLLSQKFLEFHNTRRENSPRGVCACVYMWVGNWIKYFYLSCFSTVIRWCSRQKEVLSKYHFLCSHFFKLVCLLFSTGGSEWVICDFIRVTEAVDRRV